MADSSQVRSNLNVFLQSKTAERLKNTLFNKMPTLELMFGLTGDKKGADGLGRPTVRQPRHRPRQRDLAAQARAVVQGAHLPADRPDQQAVHRRRQGDGRLRQRPGGRRLGHHERADEALQAAAVPKFARFKMPYKIPHSEVRSAMNSATTEGQAAKAVGSVYDVEVKNRTAVLCEKLNADLFLSSTAGVPTDEDAIQWDRFHSLLAALKTDNTYGGVDRSLTANSWWRGNYSTSQFSGSFEDLIEYINYDLGLLAKGLSVQVLLVGKTLMKKAKAEARASGYQLISPTIPDPSTGSSARWCRSTAATAASSSATTRRLTPSAPR
jgi:hypothetical protein